MWALGVVGCALGTLATKARSWPDLTGERAADGLAAPVWVGRDRYGVPHVRARTDEDAWFALGYAHGQDRLFQADLTRRAAFGRLSEWLGEDAVEVDVFARSLGLEDLARAEVERADPATRAMLEAYARGIDAAAAAEPALPVEHRLLGAAFEPWRPEDCLGVAYLMAWTLAENARHELAAWELRDLPTDVVDRLLRTNPEPPPVDAYWEALRVVRTGPLTPAFRAWTDAFGGAPTSAASNDWIVGPARSADGFPIVANDPHLTQTVPSLWYAADVSGATFHAAGATLPGLPGFPVGHSAHVAWGVTNVMADQQDVAVLERRGDGYVLGGEVLPFEDVAIDLVVDGRRRTEHALRTRVGPVISDPDAPAVLALRWSALEVEDELPSVLRRLAGARTVDDVLPAAADARMVVALNLVAADDAKGWGWQTSGAMVRRKAHTGRVPYPASDPAHGWDGWLAGTPGSGPTAEGYLVTANARPEHPLADAIATTYIPDHRQARLSELLAARSDHTPAGQAELQADRREMDAARWRDVWLAGVAPPPGDAATCAALLRGWDLDAGARSAGALVWATFVGDLQDVVLSDDLTPAQRAVVRSVDSSGQSVLDSGALPSFSADPAADATAALGRTCAALRAAFGDDPGRWTWGAAHPLALRHPFAERAPRLLSEWNPPTAPSGGTGATVAAAGYPLTGPFPREVGGMQSLRAVMPLSDLGASTLVYPGGQSGQPGAPFYRSHFADFVHDRTLPLRFDDEDLVGIEGLWLRP